MPWPQETLWCICEHQHGPSHYKRWWASRQQGALHVKLFHWVHMKSWREKKNRNTYFVTLLVTHITDHNIRVWSIGNRKITTNQSNLLKAIKCDNASGTLGQLITTSNGFLSSSGLHLNSNAVHLFIKIKCNYNVSYCVSNYLNSKGGVGGVGHWPSLNWYRCSGKTKTKQKPNTITVHFTCMLL